MIRFHHLGIGLAFCLAACGSAEPVDTDPGPDPDPTDTEPPVIADVAPADGATGVEATASIVVHFSEPMNQASVEAAYASDELPAGAVTFYWNDAGDTLSIVPGLLLAYAEGVGNDPSVVEAASYAFTIGTGATDLAGNALGNARTTTFATRRRMTTSLVSIPAQTRARLSNNTSYGEGIELRMGEVNDSIRIQQFATMDLAPLPEGILEIEQALLLVRQTAPVGTPYDIGSIGVEHLIYEDVQVDAVGAPAISLPGVLSADGAVETKQVDVTSQVDDDYGKRVERSNRNQYRMAFPAGNNGNGESDYARFDRSTLQLSVVYLVD